MRMLTLATGLAVVLMLVTTAANVQAANIRDRQIHQQKRIHQGVRSGQLTPRETLLLQREQTHIQRMKRRAWSDGCLTRGERVLITGRQNRAGHRIYRYKHNDYQR